MLAYTKDEAIEDMANYAQVMPKGYGTWNCIASLGYRDEKAKDSFTTHDEDWKTGIFDGETYNPQNFEEWFAEQEWEEHGWDGTPDMNDSEVRSLFDDYCSAVWSDSANEDNYEPSADRDRRIAEKIMDEWLEGNCPDNVVVSDDGDHIYVLADSELEAMDGDNRLLNALLENDTETFKRLLDEYEENL